MQATLSCTSVRPAVRCVAARPAAFTAAPAARPVRRQQQQQCSATAAPEAPAPAAASKPEPSYSGAAETYAVVDIGGHQLIVEEGRWYTVNRLEVEPGSKIQLGRVLALKQGGKFTVGQPYLEGVRVEAEVLEELKGPKVIIYKYKAKKHFRRQNGHRQPLSKILITKVA